jgi:alkylhydroperoxidase family enzyme
MKATLAHSLLAFDVYMQWYPLYAEVEKILGKRLAYLYAYSISYSSDCPLCSTFFRKIIIDSGEKPETLELTASEQKILDFGSSIAKHHGNIADHVYDGVASHFNKKELIVLIAFAGQMIATNVFNNVVQTDIDDYLFNYLPPVKNAST